MSGLACLAGMSLLPSLTLAQSPGYSWAKNMGGTGADLGLRMVTDAAGNTYTTGSFTGTADFNLANPGVNTLTSAGGTDVFVTKMDAAGNYVWAVNMGGTLDDAGQSIAVDAAGNVYLTGVFRGTADFDPAASGTTNLVSAGMADIFVMKLDAAGVSQWALGTGSVSDDAGNAIVLDATGNVYIAGNFGAMSTVDFDPDAVATADLTSAGGSDDFVWKLTNGGGFVFVKQMGGTVNDLCNAIGLDASGNIYVAGSYNGTSDFNLASPGVNTLSSAGSNDIFVCKMDASGNFQWVNGMGAGMTDIALGLIVDNADNVLVTGSFANTVDFDPDMSATASLTASGLSDPFVCKFDGTGDLVWARHFTGSGFDRGTGLAVDASNNVYVTGAFASTMDFDPDAVAVANLTSAGGNDVFICKLTSAGVYDWAINMGGTGDDGGQSVRLAAGKIFVAGRQSLVADFNPDAVDTDNLTSAGSTDIFVAQYAPPCTPTDSTLTTTQCDSYTANATTYTTSGTYIQTLTNAGGCDSTLTIVLTINHSTDSTIIATACDSYTLNGTTYTTTGIYTQDLANAAGCDSTITLNLTINSADAGTLSTVGTTITTSAISATGTYQWINCATNAPITGETNQSFTATANGNYAVVVTHSGCTDTSSCTNITGIGINEISNENIIAVYPNPSNGAVTMMSAENGNIAVTDMNGKTVYSKAIVKGNNQLDFGNLTTGVYSISFEGKNQKIKWIKL